MILTRVEIENFGIFLGKHVFNLSPEKTQNSEKSIILFGGKNGSGKTTLFEAIRICLYGESFKGNRLTKSKYHRFLKNRINRYSYETKENPRTSISVEFKYGQFGYVDTYLIKRSWEDIKGKLVTNLEVFQNGKPLRDVYEKQWKDFVMELIPRGLSKLFFFDGEQIQNLAQDELDNRHLIHSIHSLLGLDLVERLQTDIKIFLSRKIKEQNTELANNISKHERTIGLLENNLDAYMQERARIQSIIDRVHAEIEDQEHKIALEGGGYANKREELKIFRERLDVNIENIKQNIRKICSSFFPFSLVPDICKSLSHRLGEEEQYQKRMVGKIAIESVAQSVYNEMSSTSFWHNSDISLDDRKELASRVLDSIRRKTNSKDEKKVEIIHSISPEDRKKVLNWIDRALNQIPKKVIRLSENLEDLTRQRQDVVSQLNRVPLNEVIHPFVRKINELHNELGVLQEKYRQVDNEVSRINNELKRIRWEIEKILSQEAKLQKQLERNVLAKKVQVALNEFIMRLRIEKIDELEEKFLECFKWLSNKGSLIEKIKINSDNFQIELCGLDDIGKISKDQLSAGEKQIFAIAILWALARISGRPLPFMIDTPLGRLDETHRERIVEKFFPSASHQVILFSTDTEIDNQLFQRLQPNIARAYHLQYNESLRSSFPSLGYFWMTQQNEAS